MFWLLINFLVRYVHLISFIIRLLICFFKEQLIVTWMNKKWYNNNIKSSRYLDWVYLSCFVNWMNFLLIVRKYLVYSLWVQKLVLLRRLIKEGITLILTWSSSRPSISSEPSSLQRAMSPVLNIIELQCISTKQDCSVMCH